MAKAVKFTEFEQGYIDCMFFTEAHPDQDEWTSDHDYMSIAPETAKRIKADCDRFIELAGDTLDSAGSDEQNGHDLWFTRNGHGVGFWDRDYPDQIGDTLTKHAETLGEIWAYIGDDNQIYMSQ